MEHIMRFHVITHQDYSAGRYANHTVVEFREDSESSGGKFDSEQIEHIRGFLIDFYDADRAYTNQEYIAILDHQNKSMPDGE
jgi:hypothetical protein